MKIQIKHYSFLLTVVIAMSLFSWVACTNKTNQTILGYAPVYIDPASSQVITFNPAQPMVNTGKIYQYKQSTFQIETGKGIHVINSSNPNSPQKVGFISIPGCHEISVKNDILYTDNFRDLIAINISNLNQLSLSARIEKVFPETNQLMPPHEGAYFECADPSKGLIIDWKETLLENPKCKR